MSTSVIRLSRSLFSNEVIIRTAHRYTGKCQVSLRIEGTDVTVVLAPLNSNQVLDNVEGRFANDVLDEQLREIVRAETHEIHSQLISAALRESKPTQPDAVS